MLRQHLRIDLTINLQHARKPIVAAAPARGRKVRQECLAHPGVISLDLIKLGGTEASDESFRAQFGQCDSAADTQFGGPERKRFANRPPGDGNHLQ